MYTQIGCFNAKTRFSELLQEVKHGQRFTITLRGCPIADLVPSENSSASQNVHAAVERMRQVNKVQGISAADLDKWVGEGRL